LDKKDKISYLKNVFSIRIYLSDSSENTGMTKFIPGSQNKLLSKQEIKTITENSNGFSCKILSGGLLILKPLLLRKEIKGLKNKNRSYLELTYLS